ncbi:thioredoxin-like protein [Gonapodya prolifera JEL478]|uniref:Glutathione S-transferase kappa n=1 Tax=Gonapodya prolifera (strain JEL478) TaxID=1344416 RepID=A0A139AN37_GONPJ|nr:thioredoxin-like protein [Gonapodya prolifera JEL478]|eukprot:KXS18157.1 thioredoxin-like protein [Gonapodya prolifera JEL478]
MAESLKSLTRPLIKFHYDVVSPYSYFGFEVLHRYKNLKLWDVDVELCPMFLGGLHGLTGNKPPSALPARGIYLTQDGPRSAKQFNVPTRPVSRFPQQTLKCMRLLTFIKLNHPEHLEAATRALMRKLQYEQGDLEVDTDVADALAFLGRERVLGWLATEISKQPVKDALTAQVRSAYESGAFGMPWWIITKPTPTGPATEVFFGSDRWPHIVDFLGLPWYGYDPAPDAASKGERWML